MTEQIPTFAFKTVLIGDSFVGKSSIIHRYCFKTFANSLDPTIGAAYATQPCKLEKSTIQFNIWDTAG